MSTEIPTNQKGDAVAWAEANMWVYRHGEISHTSAVSERPVHAIQGFQVNRGEPVSSASLCKMRYARQPKGRMAKVLQVVGCPNRDIRCQVLLNFYKQNSGRTFIQ